MKIFILLSLISANLTASELTPKNQDLKYFLGTWLCSGTYKITDKGKSDTRNFKHEKVVFRSILQGHWVEGDYSYSIDQKEFLNRCLYGNNGDHFLLNCYGTFPGMVKSRSQGWKGNTMEFKGVSYYHDFENQESKKFTRVSNKEYRAVSIISHKKTKYSAEFRATCLKQ